MLNEEGSNAKGRELEGSNVQGEGSNAEERR